MARPGLLRHRKFARLARLIGSRPAALGHLEMLWETAYENGDDLLGDAGDVEFIAEWAGEPGRLAAALVESGFLDFDQESNSHRVHDLWDHAPDYVSGRRGREDERRKAKLCESCGKEFHSSDSKAKFCSDACRQAAFRTRSKSGDNDAVTQHNAGVRDAPSCVTQSNGTPAPAPAPAPISIKTPLSAGADRAAVGVQGEPPQAPPDAPPIPPAEKPDQLGAQVREVFEHWRQVMHKTLPTKLGDKRRRVVEARLREGYTAEQLCLAIDGCALTPHNMGFNDRGTPYNDLELICRDAPHVDRFLATAEKAKPPEPAEEKTEPCSICGSAVGAVGRTRIGDAVLCVLCAQRLEHADGRPSQWERQEQKSFDLAWVAEHRRSAA